MSHFSYRLLISLIFYATSLLADGEKALVAIIIATLWLVAALLPGSRDTRV